MGVPGLWEVLRPAASIKSLTHLAVADGFEANNDGHRGFRIGIDASIWIFHTKVLNGTGVGERAKLQMLFFRCAKLMNAPILPLFMFDGPKRPKWKRGKRVVTTNYTALTAAMQNIIRAFGYQWRCAPGEAEAELAYLNRIGAVDAVLTDDVDAFLFGATTVIRNPSNTLNGNRSHPIKNAKGRDDGNHVLTFNADDLCSCVDVQLTQGGLILIALLSGGDYHQGVRGVGVTLAHGLARCGFGDSLVQAVRTMTGVALESFLCTWRNKMLNEMRTNSRGIIGRKFASVAKFFPRDFPDLAVVNAYVNPIVSASTECPPIIDWRCDPKLDDLGSLWQAYFGRRDRAASLKRFGNVIWRGAVCRILRRSVLQVDNLVSLAARHPDAGISRKHFLRDALAQGTPSTMITQYFSRLDINSLLVREFNEPTATSLILKIHRERRDVCTDGLKEYRLEISPAQLARLAEQGLTTVRSTPNVNSHVERSYEADEEDEADNDHDPSTVLRVWMPASMVNLVEPRLVREYEEEKERKGLRKKTTINTKRKAKTIKSLKNEYFSDSGDCSEPKTENVRIRHATALSSSSRSDPPVLARTFPPSSENHNSKNGFFSDDDADRWTLSEGRTAPPLFHTPSNEIESSVGPPFARTSRPPESVLKKRDSSSTSIFRSDMELSRKSRRKSKLQTTRSGDYNQDAIIISSTDDESTSEVEWERGPACCMDDVIDLT